MSKIDIIFLFQNLNQLKFFGSVTQLMAGKVYTEIQKLFPLHGDGSPRVAASSLQKYLKSKRLQIKDVINNWPPEIPFRIRSPYSQDEFSTLISSIPKWSVTKQVATDASNYMNSLSNTFWSPNRSSTRKFVHNSIINLFKNQFKGLRFKKGFLSLLGKYLASSKLEIYQVIENWPKSVSYRYSMFYKKLEYQRLISTIPLWKVSDTVSADLVDFSWQNKLLIDDARVREHRAAIAGKIRDMFKAEFDSSFLNHGLFSMLQRYLDSPQLAIHQVIENWPSQIAFNSNSDYSIGVLETLYASMNKWTISPTRLSDIKFFKESYDLKRKATDQYLNPSKKARF
jgi:hypothetical protein